MTIGRRSPRRALAAVASFLLLAAACTSGDDGGETREPTGGAEAPAGPVGGSAADWRVSVDGARTETELAGDGGTIRPNPGEVFLVVDLSASGPDGSSLTTRDVAVVPAGGEPVAARGGGDGEEFCVGCPFRQPVGLRRVSASFVFVLPEVDLSVDLSLEVGDLEPTPLEVRRGGSEAEVHTPDLALLATSAPTRQTISSDLAFWGDLAYAGSYDGFRIIDISDPRAPEVLAEVRCRTRQGDISVWDGLVFLSTDTPTSDAGCAEGSHDTTAGARGAFEGIRVFDARDTANVRLVASVRTDCGSHTHSLYPDPGAGRVLLYVSSYPAVETSLGPNCRPPFGRFSVVEVPLSRPDLASVAAEVPLPGTPLYEWGNVPGFTPGRGCHDIQVFVEMELAAAACMGEGQLWDLSDPVHPRITTHIDNPAIAFWHSAAFTWDGRYVVFGDERFSDQDCESSTAGAVWIYDLDDPRDPITSFQVPRPQPTDFERGLYCTAHNFNFVPVPDRYLMVSAWYQAGTTVIDMTDVTEPREVAFYDAQVPTGSDAWSAYWYDGLVVANDIGRGVDVFRLSIPGVQGARPQTHLNPQTQERLLR